MERHPAPDGFERMTAKKPAKPKPKAPGAAPCHKCKSFTVTPSRNRAGRFVSKKDKQKSFKF